MLFVPRLQHYKPGLDSTVYPEISDNKMITQMCWLHNATAYFCNYQFANSLRLAAPRCIFRLWIWWRRKFHISWILYKGRRLALGDQDWDQVFWVWQPPCYIRGHQSGRNTKWNALIVTVVASTNPHTSSTPFVNLMNSCVITWTASRILVGWALAWIQNKPPSS